MAFTRLPLDSVVWAAGGNPLERKKTAAAGATVIEFAPGFADPNWCERAHVAYVLSGTLRLEVAGRIEEVAAGDGFVTDRGTPHRASNPGADPVRLFVITAE
ncbi:MAG: cupin domain-containing protein [Thermoanaerobaculales bacterium]